jgi:chromatin structure-remodeling complex protein RSC7
MHYPKITQPTHSKWEYIPAEEEEPAAKRRLLTNGSGAHDEPTIFKPVSQLIARNFLVADTLFINPPISGIGVPGSNAEGFDASSHGLPDASPEVLEALPAECREALLAAKDQEREWKSLWATEKEDGLRPHLEISYLGFPV